MVTILTTEGAVKLSLFVGNTISYTENSKKKTHKIYSSSEHPKIKMKKTIIFIISSKK